MTLSDNWRTGKISEKGIALLRIWLGIIMIKHSYPVILENGFSDFSDWLKSMNIPLPYLMAYLSKGGEFFGGILLATGFFTRIGAFFIMTNMMVAVLVANHGTIFTKAELPFDYFLISLMIFLFGSDKLSLDHFLSSKKITT